VAARIVAVFPLLLKRICKQVEKVLEDKGYSVKAFYSDISISEKELLNQAPDLEAVVVFLGKVNGKVLEKVRRLKVVCKLGVGVDNIEIEVAAKRHIVVINIPGVNAESVKVTL